MYATKAATSDNARRDLLEVIYRAALEPQREFLARLDVGEAHTILDAARRGVADQEDRLIWAEWVEGRDRREKRALQAKSLLRARSLIRPAPPDSEPVVRNVRAAVGRAIRSGNDWRDYIWGHEVVWDLLRHAVGLLAAELGADSSERENLFASIVAEVIESAGLARLDAKTREVADLPVEHLLTELLGVFGPAEAPGFQLWYQALMAAINPQTPAADVRQLLGKLSRKETDPVDPAELAGAGPLLRGLVGQVRALRKGPFPAPQKYSATVGRIVQSWNACARNTRTLPFLCKKCWRPVRLRQPSFERTNQGKVRVSRSEVCSERCKRRDNKHP